MTTKINVDAPRLRPHLRECPFCGAPNEDIIMVTTIYTYPDGSEVDVENAVSCGGCGAVVKGMGKEEAANTWNGNLRSVGGEATP